MNVDSTRKAVPAGGWPWPALLLAFALAGCGRPAGPALIARPLASLVPSDSTTLAGGRMAPLRNSQIYQRYVAAQPAPAIEESIRQWGLDPRKDLDEFLVASNGKGAVVLMKGNFRSADLEETLRRKGASTSDHERTRVWELSEGSLAIIAPDVAVAGSGSLVKQALSSRARSLEFPASMREIVDSIPADAHLWTASVDLSGINPPRTGAGPGISKVAGSIERLTAWASLGSGVKLTSAARCAGEPDAKKLAGALRGLIGLARLNTPAASTELLKLYDAIAVKHNGSDVRVDAYFPGEVLDAVAGQLRPLLGGKS